MKIIFPEDYQISEILGFLDADIRPDKIKSELLTACKDLKKLVGPEAYAYAEAINEKAQPEDDEKFALYTFRYPVALQAYAMYAPSGDLSHTNNGRKMRNDEHEKNAFEWMILRDNENLEKKYYQALDNLLDYLDDENPILVQADAGNSIGELKWKATDAYMQSHKLFVRTTADFDEYYPINSRFLLLKLQPGISRCERVEIMPRLGKEKFDLYKAILRGENEDEEPDTILLELIKEACVYYALAYGIRRLRVSLLPEGILQRYQGDRNNANASKPAEKMEAELTAQSFESDAKKVLQAIESYTRPAMTAEELEEFSIYPDDPGDECDNFLST